MEHKALKYQMKTMISNFTDDILRPILLQLENSFRTSFKINIILKSYKCYESGLMFKDKKITGYGRNEVEAFRICMKNFMEFLTENEVYIEYLKTALSNVKNIGDENDEKKSIKNNKNLEIDTVNCSPVGNKMLNHTKEFGNISSINMIETPQNLCTSILENDCLLVKMLNENHGSKMLENSVERPKYIRINAENEFRKQKLEKPSCPCNHEELLIKALKEISLLNKEIVSLKTENEALRTFICNKENEDASMKKNKKSKGGHSVNPSKRDENDYSYHKGNGNGSNNLLNEEKNFIAKLQANLGLASDKFKML